MEKKHHALPLPVSRISDRIYYCTLNHRQTSTREYVRGRFTFTWSTVSRVSEPCLSR